jgi:hypothetical protein
MDERAAIAEARVQRTTRLTARNGREIKELRKEVESLKEQRAEDRELLGRLKEWASGSTRTGSVYEDEGRCSARNYAKQRCTLPKHDHHTECEF